VFGNDRVDPRIHPPMLPPLRSCVASTPWMMEVVGNHLSTKEGQNDLGLGGRVFWFWGEKSNDS